MAKRKHKPVPRDPEEHARKVQAAKRAGLDRSRQAARMRREQSRPGDSIPLDDADREMYGIE